MSLTIGQRIRQRRKELRLTQHALGQLCGDWGQSRIRNYEAGERIRLDPRTLQKLADALQVTPEWLQWGVEPHTLSDDERQVLGLYRSITPTARRHLRYMMQRIAEAEAPDYAATKPAPDPTHTDR